MGENDDLTAKTKKKEKRGWKFLLSGEEERVSRNEENEGEGSSSDKLY